MFDESTPTSDEQGPVESQASDPGVDEAVEVSGPSKEPEGSEKADDLGVDEKPNWRQELKRKNSENQNLRARAKAAELKVMKFEAAAAAGLPAELAQRLQGSTAEELAEDAKNFLQFVGRRGAPGGLPNNGRNDGGASDADEPSLDEIGKRMYRI